MYALCALFFPHCPFSCICVFLFRVLPAWFCPLLRFSFLGFSAPVLFGMGYYGEINKGYDALHFEEQAEKARIILANCSIHGLLLDIGAGTGKVTSLFSGQAECIALDPSKEMLCNYAGLKVVARAEQLPFKNACFDSVVSLTALHHADLAMAKKDILRVSRPNACIAISFFKRAGNFAEAKKLFLAFRQIGSEKDLIFVKC
jgi:ubiquinone/menaquinone biosynthesis C-methylase UbiE